MNLFGFFICTLFVAEGWTALRLPGSCPTVALSNGRVRYRQRAKIARFICNPGFKLAGDRYSVCVGGKWDNLGSRCVRASCKGAKPPVNGLIYPSYGGAVLNFYCKSGYELNGANITYCDGVRWSNPLPACLASNSTPSLSCDFEQPDLCGWNHDLNHDFDWKRLNYATPSGSIGTGPSHDHTKGPGKDGYYMYIESSARNINDTSRLISPIYNKSNETVCFEFYYHMYGFATGSLRVYLQKVNETWKLNPKHALFIKSGNQGNRWYRGFVVLGPIDKEFQVVIEGVRGDSYVSDIAIDDVRIITNCVPENEILDEETTTEGITSETPISVESCEHRCNTNDNRTSEWLITCDCDDGCFERNRCCPDYFDFCVAGSTDDFAETTEEVITIVETAITKTKLTTYLLQTTTPTKKSRTISTTTTTLRPPKTKTTTTVATTRRSTIPSDKINESKIVNVKPDDDYSDVPVTASIEVEETPRAPIKETEIINDYESDKTFDHQKIEVRSNMHESNTKTIVFAVGVVFGVLFAMVGMAFVARRYQLCNCDRMKLNHSSNGDSQSDVRFLTSDEVLDFSLACDYDSL